MFLALLNYVQLSNLINAQFILSYKLFMQMFSHTGPSNTTNDSAQTDVNIVSYVALHQSP